MQNYDALIMSLLNGDTPKEKYEHALEVFGFLSSVANPEADSIEAGWDKEDIADIIAETGLLSARYHEHNHE